MEQPIALPKSIPQPVYSFQVNNIDFPSVYSTPQPDENIENIIGQLQNAAIFIEGMPGQFKYGDTFTLYGKEAARVKSLYIGQIPKILELFSLPNVDNLAIVWDNAFGSATVTWTPDSNYITEISYNNDNGAIWTTIGFYYGVGIINLTFGSSSNVDVYVRARFTNYQGAFSPNYATDFMTSV